PSVARPRTRSCAAATAAARSGPGSGATIVIGVVRPSGWAAPDSTSQPRAGPDRTVGASAGTTVGAPAGVVAAGAPAGVAMAGATAGVVAAGVVAVGATAGVVTDGAAAGVVTASASTSPASAASAAGPPAIVPPIPSATASSSPAAPVTATQRSSLAGRLRPVRLATVTSTAATLPRVRGCVQGGNPPSGPLPVAAVSIPSDVAQPGRVR